MPRVLAAVLVLTVAACGDRRPPGSGTTNDPPPAEAVSSVPPAAAPPAAIPTGPLPPTTVATRAETNPADVGSSRVEAHACARVGPTRTVRAGFGAPAAVGLAVGHVVAARIVEPGGDAIHVVVVDEAGRGPREVVQLPMTPPLAVTQLVPPGLARLDGGRVAVAAVDGARGLVYREVDLGTAAVTPPLMLVDGVADSRFPPSIAVAGELRLVAYTKVGNPQHVEVVVVSGGAVVRRHDVTQFAAGAASPSFIRDLVPPVVISVDPREALSLAHAIAFDAAGTPAADRSLQPIISLATPARITAVRGAADSELFFLAHGSEGGVGVYHLSAAASAITPRTVVPPAAAGRPWVDALGTAFGAIVTATAPREDDPSKREVVVRLLDGSGLGPMLRLGGPVAVEGAAIYPTPSRDDEGHLAVVSGAANGFGFVRLACRGE